MRFKGVDDKLKKMNSDYQHSFESFMKNVEYYESRRLPKSMNAVKVSRPVSRDKNGVAHPRKVTVVKWDDGTSTKAMAEDGTKYDPFTGLLLCVVKRMAMVVSCSRWKDILNYHIEHSESMLTGTGIISGLDANSAYKVILFDAANDIWDTRLPMQSKGSYENGHFFELLADIIAQEICAVADPMTEKFTHQLTDIRQRVIKERWDEKRDAALKKSEKFARDHGASEWEAFLYAKENARIPKKRNAYVTEDERKSIFECARKEAMAFLYSDVIDASEANDGETEPPKVPVNFSTMTDIEKTIYKLSPYVKEAEVDGHGDGPVGDPNKAPADNLLEQLIKSHLPEDK